MIYKWGKEMNRRDYKIVISVSPDMESDLKKAAEKCYSTDSQDEIARDLIIRGLKLNKEKEKFFKRFTTHL